MSQKQENKSFPLAPENQTAKKLKDGTVWLSQLQIAELFQTSKQNISKHILAIYEDQELDKTATVNQQLTVQKGGKA